MTTPDRAIMITGEIGRYRARKVGERYGAPVYEVLLDDGTPDPSWQAFRLQPEDYIDMGEWEEETP